jgi:1-aminocyclopropane-1-carboxylate deaminase/D-cysteine desulfhydrase-like pyridoxal-dependent ACC family enzyme
MFDAGLEAIEQLKPLINEPYIIVHASATGGVSAGLRLAAGTASSCVAVHSVAVVSDIYADMEERYREICLAAKNDLGLNAVAPLTLSFEQVGNSYSAPPAAAIEAALNFTQAEGILADERYIGRALAYIRQIAVTTGLPIVLWHTGGGIGVFDK